jgi:glutamyl-tRNA synthetase
LVAWLFARASGSAFTLRVEDLDPQRSRPEHEALQLADLRAIGVDWDGEVLRQSARTARYREALDRLEAAGRVYPCWCSRAEIRAAAEAPHGELPEGAYPGTCRGLSAEEQERRRQETGRPPALRLDARAEVIAFEDRLRGGRRQAVDDIVLWRGDGTPAYNLAVVVDDAAQGIEEVVRGDDLLDTTPRQILLARLLGLPERAYAHVALVLGPGGQRLTKRHGAVALGEGPWDPATALGWMAQSLGLAKPGEHPTASDLVGRFEPDRLPREPTVLLQDS